MPLSAVGFRIYHNPFYDFCNKTKQVRMRPDSMQERLRLANNSDKHKTIDDWALEK